MGKGRRPTASKLKEKRNHRNTSQVYLDPSKIEDEEWLNSFLGKIFFWSFTLHKVRPSDHSTKFRVCTHRFIPRHKIFPLVERVFPGGCEVKLSKGYSFTHTFDVTLSRPLRWDTFIWRVTKTLEKVL